MDFSKLCDNLDIPHSLVGEVYKFAEGEIKRLEGDGLKVPLATKEGAELMDEVLKRVEEWVIQKKNEDPILWRSACECCPSSEDDNEVGESNPNVHPNELLWRLYTEGKWGTEKGKVYDEISNPELGRVAHEDLQWFMNQTSYVLRGNIYHTSPDGFYDADTPTEALSIISGDPEKTQEIMTNYAYYWRDMNKYCKENNYKNRTWHGGEPEKVERKWKRRPGSYITMPLSPSDQMVNPHAILDRTEDFTLVKHGVPKMCDNPNCCLMAHVMMFLAPTIHRDARETGTVIDPPNIIQWFLDIPIYSKDNQEELCALCIHN